MSDKKPGIKKILFQSLHMQYVTLAFKVTIPHRHNRGFLKSSDSNNTKPWKHKARIPPTQLKAKNDLQRKGAV